MTAQNFKLQVTGTHPLISVVRFSKKPPSAAPKIHLPHDSFKRKGKRPQRNYASPLPDSPLPCYKSAAKDP